eukprot:5105925-Pleurochrysis_carterae.AAC.2
MDFRRCDHSACWTVAGPQRMASPGGFDIFIVVPTDPPFSQRSEELTIFFFSDCFKTAKSKKTS